MQPREAVVTFHHIRRVPTEMSVDGRSWNYREVDETEQVQAEVWPVSAGNNKMVVEYMDKSGELRLRAVDMRDIRLF